MIGLYQDRPFLYIIGKYQAHGMFMGFSNQHVFWWFLEGNMTELY